MHKIFSTTKKSKIMRISEKAKTELRKILIEEIGEEKTNNLSDEELNQLGVLFLTILSENIKMKVVSPELLTPVL